MNLLVHICCAPCVIYPFEVLKKEGFNLTGFFYNPNIHPYTEYKKRFDTLKNYSNQNRFMLIFKEEYPIEKYFKIIYNFETERCWHCYFERMSKTAQMAISMGYDAFTTTLLYSKYQNHEMVKKIGEILARNYNTVFFYRDFRSGWLEGVEKAKKFGMYRQAYCGCIFSEKERYYSAK